MVALRILAGLTAEETAEALDIAPATVHVHLHRALAALRVHLGAREDWLSAREEILTWP